MEKGGLRAELFSDCLKAHINDTEPRDLLTSVTMMYGF